MYLDSLCGLEALLRRDAHLPLPEERLDEAGDVAAGDGDVLDAGADHVALRLEIKGGFMQNFGRFADVVARQGMVAF